jgi:hypothetical protein
LKTGLRRSGNWFGGLWLASSALGCTGGTHFQIGDEIRNPKPLIMRFECCCKLRIEKASTEWFFTRWMLIYRSLASALIGLYGKARIASVEF